MQTLIELLIIFFILFAMIALLFFSIFKLIQKKVRKYTNSRKRRKKKNQNEPVENEFEKAFPNEFDPDKPYWTEDPKHATNEKNLTYHMNIEGKIYPCKISQCPYGKKVHSNNKVDLYYTFIKTVGGRVDPHKDVLEKIVRFNSLHNLYPLSSTLEEADYPIDLIVSTLGHALVAIDEETIHKKYYHYSKRSDFETTASEYLAELIHNGGQERFEKIKHRIPHKILEMRFDHFTFLEDRDKHFEQGLYSTNHWNNKKREEVYKQREKSQEFYEKVLRRMFAEFDKYREDENWGIYDNKFYHQQFGWFIRAFEQFSHDLNTSKIITQPIFYQSIEKAKETIKNLGDHELQSAFDDCSMTSEEIDQFVREANYFNFTRRRDLTEKANDNLSRWYAMNRDTYIKLKQVSPSHRDVLAKEAAKELAQRGLLQTETTVG